MFLVFGELPRRVIHLVRVVPIDLVLLGRFFLHIALELVKLRADKFRLLMMLLDQVIVLLAELVVRGGDLQCSLEQLVVVRLQDLSERYLAHVLTGEDRIDSALDGLAEVEVVVELLRVRVNALLTLFIWVVHNTELTQAPRDAVPDLIDTEHLNAVRVDFERVKLWLTLVATLKPILLEDAAVLVLLKEEVLPCLIHHHHGPLPERAGVVVDTQECHCVVLQLRFIDCEHSDPVLECFGLLLVKCFPRRQALALFPNLTLRLIGVVRLAVTVNAHALVRILKGRLRNLDASETLPEVVIVAGLLVRALRRCNRLVFALAADQLLMSVEVRVGRVDSCQQLNIVSHLVFAHSSLRHATLSQGQVVSILRILRVNIVHHKVVLRLPRVVRHADLVEELMSEAFHEEVELVF